MNKLWYLSQISLFEALSDEELEEIAVMTPMSTISKNTLIQTPDTFREGLYMLKRGKLKLYKLNANGKKFIVSILGDGNVFGETDSFSLGTRGTYIETMNETILCTLGKAQFEKFLAERPHLSIKIMKEMSRMLNERDAMLAQLAMNNVRDRLLHLLHTLALRFGVSREGLHEIDVPLSHEEIANMVGSTRETVTTVLGDLADEGIIRTGRMVISVNLAKIAEWVS